MNPLSSPPFNPASPLLAIPRSAVVFIADLDDARRLAAELDPSATDLQREERAADILAGRLLVVRGEAPATLDTAPIEQVPSLCSLMEAR